MTVVRRRSVVEFKNSVTGRQLLGSEHPPACRVFGLSKHSNARQCRRAVLRGSYVAILLLIFGGLGFGSSARADQFVAIAGTRVSLLVPQKFVVADDFAGVIWKDAGASLHIAELPMSAEQMQVSLTKPQLASRGMVLLDSEQVDSAIGPSLLLHISQNAQGIEFRKWMLVGGNSSDTVLLTATVPATLAGELQARLRQCLLTARWEPLRQVDPRAGVAFTVSESPDLRIAKSVMGSALLLTLGGVETTSSASDPFVVVTRSTAAVAISDLAAFSKRRLGETNKLSNATIHYETDLSIDGMPAHELVALATAEQSVPVVVHQVVVFDGRHYFVVQGRVGVGEQDRYLGQFRDIARSLSVK